MTHNEERNLVDLEMKLFLNRVKKMNAKLKHIQVTDVKIKINEPAPVYAVPLWKRFFKFKSST